MTRDEMIRTAMAMLNEKHAHAQRIGVEQVIDIMISIGALTPEPDHVLRPPVAASNYKFHWLREPLQLGQRGAITKTVAEWEKQADGWRIPGLVGYRTPQWMHQTGYAYLGPVTSVAPDEPRIATTGFPPTELVGVSTTPVAPVGA